MSFMLDLLCYFFALSKQRIVLIDNFIFLLSINELEACISLSANSITAVPCSSPSYLWKEKGLSCIQTQPPIETNLPFIPQPGLFSRHYQCSHHEFLLVFYTVVVICVGQSCVFHSSFFWE